MISTLANRCQPARSGPWRARRNPVAVILADPHRERVTSSISHTSVDCRNAYQLSQWWKEVLGYTDVPGDPNEPGHPECMIIDPERCRAAGAVH